MTQLAWRRRLLLITGAAAALLAGGGVIGASFVKSPQQLAADTAPPASTVTTAPVVSQVLTSSVQMRGEVYPSTEYAVYATAPESDSSGPSTSSSQVYISRLDTAAGDTIGDGERLAEIDGAPLFALAGPVPAWRDLSPGESGPDVSELQHALASLGYYHDGDTPGYYGSATEYAVTLFFDHLGYTPPANGGVPLADVVFLPSLPATVIAVNGTTGQQPGQPFLELTAKNALTVTGELPPAYAGQVKAGLRVQIYDEVTGIRASGTVAGLGTPTGTTPTGTVVNVNVNGTASGSSSSNSSSSNSNSSNSSGSSGSSNSSGSSGSGSSGSSGTPFVPLTVRPSSPLPGALNGENVLVTVDTGQTEGPVLTVPVAAVVTNASGTSHVTVVSGDGRQADGRQAEITVTPGISENGYVQVTPAVADALKPGENVVVSG